MDELEQRLSTVLTRASDAADRARLTNPADAVLQPRGQAPGRRPRTMWITAASGLTAAAVVLAVTLAGPALLGWRHHADPGVPTSYGPARDGVWRLTVAQGGPGAAQGPGVTLVPVPTPYTVDPQLTVEPGAVPTLVTATARVPFPGARAVHLLAERPTGVFVAVEGADRPEGDGLHDVRLMLVQPGLAPRELFSAARADAFAVSPGGGLVAAVLPAGGEGTGAGASVALVDVASAQVTHRLPGAASGAAWASDSVLVLGGDGTRVARAPWTGAPERVAGPASVLAVDGGVVLADDQGCLRRLDAAGRDLEATCGGWTLAGQVSPDGRYLPLQWQAKDGTTTGGVLDVRTNTVHTWPGGGINPSWVSAAAFLLTDGTVEDSPDRFLCLLPEVVCQKATYQPWWETDESRGAQWLGQ